MNSCKSRSEFGSRQLTSSVRLGGWRKCQNKQANAHSSIRVSLAERVSIYPSQGVCGLKTGRKGGKDRIIEPTNAEEHQYVPNLVAVTHKIESTGPALFGKVVLPEDKAHHVTAKTGEHLVQNYFRLNAAIHVMLFITFHICTYRFKIDGELCASAPENNARAARMT
jgi:hypothetical protein